MVNPHFTRILTLGFFSSCFFFFFLTIGGSLGGHYHSSRPDELQTSSIGFVHSSSSSHPSSSRINSSHTRNIPPHPDHNNLATRQFLASSPSQPVFPNTHLNWNPHYFGAAGSGGNSTVYPDDYGGIGGQTRRAAAAKFGQEKNPRKPQVRT